MNLLIIGPSGSGKDTQGNLLVDRYGYSLIPIGQLLRDLCDTGDSEIERMVKDEMNAGFLPDNFVMGVLEIYLKAKRPENLILPGNVRHFEQIDMMDDVLGSLNQKLDRVILIDISRETAIERLRGRVVDSRTGAIYHNVFNPPPVEAKDYLLEREDDKKLEFINNRLNAYYEDIEKIKAEYQKRGILHVIDGEANIEDVHKRIVTDLGL